MVFPTFCTDVTILINAGVILNSDDIGVGRTLEVELGATLEVELGAGLVIGEN